MRLGLPVQQFLLPLLINLPAAIVFAWWSKLKSGERKWLFVLTFAMALGSVWRASRRVLANVPALVNLTPDAAKLRCEESNLKQWRKLLFMRNREAEFTLRLVILVMPCSRRRLYGSTFTAATR